ncbi:NAD-dependent epimerase/dehydratase family protein [Streptomyces sp. NPDC055722]
MACIDAVVTGAGGFIGGHLTSALLAEGKSVRAVDRKPLDEWYQAHDGAENVVGDVSLRDTCNEILDDGAEEVYHLAADMVGCGGYAVLVGYGRCSLPWAWAVPAPTNGAAASTAAVAAAARTDRHLGDVVIFSTLLDMGWARWRDRERHDLDKRNE